MSDKVMVTVRVGEDTKSRLDKLCEENGLKMRWVVEQAIIQYCDEHESSQTAAVTPIPLPSGWSLSNIREHYGGDAARRFCNLIIEEIDRYKSDWEVDSERETNRWKKIRDVELDASEVGGGGSSYYRDANFVVVLAAAKKRFLDEFGDKL